MIRRLKKDVLAQLPEKRRQKVPLELSTSSMREVRKGAEELSGDVLEVVGAQGDAVSNVFKLLAKAKLPAVKEYLLEVLERGDDKIIIFAHHHIMLDAISELLQGRLAKDGLKHI